MLDLIMPLSSGLCAKLGRILFAGAFLANHDGDPAHSRKVQRSSIRGNGMQMKGRNVKIRPYDITIKDDVKLVIWIQ